MSVTVRPLRKVYGSCISTARSSSSALMYFASRSMGLARPSRILILDLFSGRSSRILDWTQEKGEIDVRIGGGGRRIPASCRSNSPEFSLVQMEVVFLLGPGFEMLRLLLPLQHLQLRLSHGLFSFSLQTQLFNLHYGSI